MDTKTKPNNKGTEETEAGTTWERAMMNKK
jgi:hypothetical protein